MQIQNFRCTKQQNKEDSDEKIQTLKFRGPSDLKTKQ